VQPGSAGARSAPLFSVHRVETVRVFAEVPEAQAGAIKIGTAASVKVYGATGAAISGKVTRLSGALDPATRTFRVEIDLPNPGEKLLPGQYAQVTLTP